MLEETPVLSICIPTFQRASCLRMALDSILIALDDVNDFVEVLVSDNGSTDDTAKVVEAFQKSLPQLQYFRHIQNLGFDHNVATCIQRARGRFIHLFSDDDAVVTPHLYRQLIKMLLQRTPDLVSLNTYIFRGDDFRNVVKTYAIDPSCLNNGPAFLEKYGLGFLSVLVFKADIAKRYLEDFRTYFKEETGSLHTYIAIKIALTKESIFISAENLLIAGRTANVGRDNIYFSYVGPQRVFTRLIDEGFLDRQTYCRFRNRMIVGTMWRRVWAFLVLNDYRHLYTQRQIMRQSFGDTWLYYVLVLPLLYLPRPMLVFPYQLFSSVLAIVRYWRHRR